MFDVFFTKLIFNLKSETKKTYLSYVWWVLEPALHVAVFYLVFSVFLNRGADGFLVFLLCGQIPFLWFAKSITNSSGSIVAGRGLIQQISISKPFFPLLVVAQDFVKQFFVFSFLFMFLIYSGIEFSFNWLHVLPVILTQLLLIIACSLIVSAITPFIPDFKFLISTGITLLMFTSGIFYSYKDVLLEQHQKLFLLNPVANLIKNYREVLITQVAPDFQALAIISTASLLLIMLMMFWYKKMDSMYARLVIQ